MNEKKPWYEEVAIPALLRHARTTYGSAMRRALDDAGYDDIPKNGLYVIGGMALGTIPLGELVEQLGVSKQVASQLVDTLVVRGYLKRAEDPEDRRKSNLTLTERGRAAAEVQAAAREKIDAKLLARVGKENVTRTRRTLAALIDLGHETTDDDAEGHRRGAASES
jgi:DNA-binding MarR family transcriptional regulator